jgi:Flp pilus assembly protein TadB
LNREEERNAQFEAIQKANERKRQIEAEQEIARERKKRAEEEFASWDREKEAQKQNEPLRNSQSDRERQERLNKPSLQGFFLTIAYYGGIVLVILFILGMLYEFNSAPPFDVDRLPPTEWEP